MIDEKKLIDRLKRRIRTPRSTMEIIRDIIPLVEIQPKVGKWIPCSERLPEESGSYLVCSKNGKVFTDHFYHEKQKWGHVCGSIAWMPYPPAYEGE